MNKGSLQLFLKKEYYKFFKGYLILFMFSGAIALVFGLYQKNLQFCQSFLIRADDLNEIITREQLIGSDSTINFELKKLQNLFSLSSVLFEVQNTTDIKSNTCHATPFGFKAEHSVVFGTKKMGELKASKKASFEDLFFTISFLIPLFIGVVGALLLFAYISKRFNANVLKPLTLISDELRDVSEFQTLNSIHSPFDEFINLVNSINKMSVQVKDSTIKIHKLEASAKTAEAAKQVAHDIRSPLSALTMILGSLEQVKEDKRIIIRTAVQRINDIANDLLLKGKSSLDDSTKTNHTIESSRLEFLAPIIDTIVSEKRIQFREKQRIEIESDISQGYGIFTKINTIELKRTISNLINNAIEALPNETGKVVIKVKASDKHTFVTIQDNGKGIPEHILKKLGEMGVSHDKEGTQSGSGLGVYHAKKTVEDSDGKFLIQSRKGVGTTITMTFNKTPAPKWFVEKLILSPNMTITSLDDDISIHQIWQGRFESKNTSNFRIKHQTFTSGSDFKTWFASQTHDAKAARLYLIDYELLNQNETGLDIIEELGFGEQAILVTSRYEEDKIRERSERLGVRLIPKAMAGFVPIEIIKPKEIFTILFDDDLSINQPIVTKENSPTAAEKTRYDLCLIDDDTQLIHWTWSAVAESKGLNIKMFSTPQAFLEEVNSIDRLTPIYVDVSLADGINGTDFAEAIHKLGFFEINLATGFQADFIEIPPFIRKVVGKDFPELAKPLQFSQI
jgi:signal transduction histidine kinase